MGGMIGSREGVINSISYINLSQYDRIFHLLLLGGISPISLHHLQLMLKNEPIY